MKTRIKPASHPGSTAGKARGEALPGLPPQDPEHVDVSLSVGSPGRKPTGQARGGDGATLTPQRLTLRLDEIASMLGVSRRHVERMRSSGKFPKPDLMMGKVPLWTPETIDRWVKGGGEC